MDSHKKAVNPADTIAIVTMIDSKLDNYYNSIPNTIHSIESQSGGKSSKWYKGLI